jgi:hypothetical protein
MSEQCQFDVCSHHPLYYCITYAQVTTFTMLHSWLSIHHCPCTFEVHVVGKSGDNIGLVCITFSLSCLLIFSPYSPFFIPRIFHLLVLFKHHCTIALLAPFHIKLCAALKSANPWTSSPHTFLWHTCDCMWEQRKQTNIMCTYIYLVTVSVMNSVQLLVSQAHLYLVV